MITVDRLFVWEISLIFVNLFTHTYVPQIISFKAVSRSVKIPLVVVFILFYIQTVLCFKMAGAQSMVAWELTSYKSDIKSIVTARPKVTGPNDVLVKVIASSVNALDVLMIDGYGHTLLNLLRKFSGSLGKDGSEFPIVLGRDFVGAVVNKGTKVSSVNIGDIVMGVTRPNQQGAHAEYVLVSDSLITLKPNNISTEEAASLLYAGLTAWSALKVSGLLFVRSSSKKKVLVLGGSGAVGSLAIQLLKVWGATVGATCNKNAIELVKTFNPDFILDYTSTQFLGDLEKYGPYDIILDAAGVEKDQFNQYTKNLKPYALASFISLNPPVLPNTDQYGLVLGNIKTVFDFFVVNVLSAPVLNSSSIRWGFFVPFPSAIKELADLAGQRKVIPVIQKTYNFSETPEAYQKVKDGHLRGKITILVNDADKLRS